MEQIHKNGMPEGKNVVICGGGLSACDTAIEYAAKGDRKFTIVEMLPQLASDVMVVNKISIDRLLNEYGVEQLVNTKVVGITDAGVEVESAEGKKVLPADVVIGAFGRARSLELADAIQNKYPMKTTIIGDCMKPAKAGSAIREGFLRGNGPQIRNSFPKGTYPRVYSARGYSIKKAQQRRKYFERERKILWI